MTLFISNSRKAALFFAVAFLQSLDNQLVPVLLPVIETEMGGAPAGHLLTAYALACGIVPFLATARGKSNRLRVLGIAALLVLGAAAVVFAATTSFPIRLALRAAAGASSGVLSMTLLLAAARESDASTRARHFSVINAGYLCALVLGVPIGALVVKHMDVETMYRAIGALALVLAIPFAVARAGNPAVDAARTGSFIRLFHRREAALILAATGIVGAAMAGIVGFLGSFLAKARNLEVDQIGAVYMWAGIGPLLAMPISGRLIARFRPHAVAIAGSLVMAAPIALFPQIATSVPTAAAVMLVCIFIETVRRAALQGSLAEAVPTADLPRYLAFRGVIVQLGLAVGFALAQPQFRAGGYELVCSVAAVLSVLAAIVLLAARRRV